MIEPQSFTEIEDSFVQGRDYEVLLEDRLAEVVILAPHGGRIEPFTTDLARAVAGEEWSLYSLVGTLQSGNRRLHLSSHLFDHAPVLELVEQAEYAIAIHGARGCGYSAVMLGGRDEALRELVRDSLEEAEFSTMAPPPGLSGEDSSNIVNRTRRRRGVQLEVTKALRRELRGTPSRRAKFVAAIREAIRMEVMAE